MTDKIRAPWTPEQVDALNRFQQYGGMHPFTCGNDHGSMNVVLMAHQDGWHCSAPACHYRQDWAHAFMADPSAWPKSPFGERHGPTPSEARRAAFPTVQGHCPACGNTLLFLGDDGHVTCSLDVCPNPSAADEVLRHAHLTECEHAAGQRQAEAALARIRALAERLNGEPASDTDQAYARAILTALDQPTPGTTATDGWTRQDDGTWTLPIDGGVIIFTRRSTPEARARFAAEWKRRHNPDPEGTDTPRLSVRLAWLGAGKEALLEAEKQQPREHCGTLTPRFSEHTERTECVLRPGHQGSHADHNGARWWEWTDKQQPDA